MASAALYAYLLIEITPLRPGIGRQDGIPGPCRRNLGRNTKHEGARITVQATIPVGSRYEPPRARGGLHVTTKTVGARTVLDGFRASGSFKCLFPHARSHGLDAVLLNSAGGVTGGDRFDLSVRAGADTSLTLTTQACERAYKAQPAETARIRNHLRVAARARLNWLPQETILFNGSALDRRLSIDLDEGARLLMVEPLVCGRPAMRETLTDIRLKDRISIRRGDDLLFLDAMRFDGALADHLALPFIANGAGAMALVVMVDPAAEGHLGPVRAMLGPTAGASLLRPDLLVCRLLAENSFALRKTLLPVLHHLAGAPLPRCWMI